MNPTDTPVTIEQEGGSEPPIKPVTDKKTVDPADGNRLTGGSDPEPKPDEKRGLSPAEPAEPGAA